jgi:Mn2+/Fe2+ NRAMP family transporter
MSKHPSVPPSPLGESTPSPGGDSKTPAADAERSLDWWQTLKSIGPAVVVAAVVLGPGSITTSSRVGTAYGYQMGWVLLLTTLLMIGMTLAALVVGVDSRRTAGDRLRASFGFFPTALLGVAVFLIVALFQSSNNRALLLAAELILPAVRDSKWVAGGLLIAFNAAVIGFFLRARSVYRIIERSMLLLVGTMIVCFGINAVVGSLDFGAALGGLVPSAESLGIVRDQLTGDLRAMIGTTFSVAGAFYQCYLVRERGWAKSQLSRRAIDPIVGIATLGGLTWLIMNTAAATLHDRIAADEITDLTSLSASLRPTFGAAASWVFAAGILAGAVSSFVGNALIGGTIMSDAIGRGASASQQGPRALTVVALLVGMAIALASVVGDMDSVAFIIVAQGLTTLGLPLMAAALWWLLAKSTARMPGLTAVVIVGFLVSCYVAVGTVQSILARFGV